MNVFKLTMPMRRLLLLGLTAGCLASYALGHQVRSAQLQSQVHHHPTHLQAAEQQPVRPPSVPISTATPQATSAPALQTHTTVAVAASVSHPTTSAQHVPSSKKQDDQGESDHQHSGDHQGGDENSGGND